MIPFLIAPFKKKKKKSSFFSFFSKFTNPQKKFFLGIFHGFILFYFIFTIGPPIGV
jgi:hypothetical protein